MSKIKVLIKEPAGKLKFAEIENTLEALQKTVGGDIETVTVASNLVIICDEDGRIKNKPYNCSCFGVDLCGTIVFVGVDGENFADVPIDEEDISVLRFVDEA